MILNLNLLWTIPFKLLGIQGRAQAKIERKHEDQKTISQCWVFTYMIIYSIYQGLLIILLFIHLHFSNQKLAIVIT